jgi:hypothetical protein
MRILLLDNREFRYCKASHWTLLRKGVDLFPVIPKVKAKKFHFVLNDTALKKDTLRNSFSESIKIYFTVYVRYTVVFIHMRLNLSQYFENNIGAREN